MTGQRLVVSNERETAKHHVRQVAESRLSLSASDSKEARERAAILRSRLHDLDDQHERGGRRHGGVVDSGQERFGRTRNDAL